MHASTHDVARNFAVMLGGNRDRGHVRALLIEHHAIVVIDVDSVAFCCGAILFEWIASRYQRGMRRFGRDTHVIPTHRPQPNDTRTNGHGNLHG
jgi:hypothetical protein